MQTAQRPAGTTEGDLDLADQQFQAGLFCGSVHAPPPTPIPLDTLAELRARLAVRVQSCKDTGAGHRERRSQSAAHPTHVICSTLPSATTTSFTATNTNGVLQFTVINLANKYALYNFLSTFSGTHYVTPRAYDRSAGVSLLMNNVGRTLLSAALDLGPGQIFVLTKTMMAHIIGSKCRSGGKKVRPTQRKGGGGGEPASRLWAASRIYAASASSAVRLRITRSRTFQADEFLLFQVAQQASHGLPGGANHLRHLFVGHARPDADFRRRNSSRLGVHESSNLANLPAEERVRTSSWMSWYAD